MMIFVIGGGTLIHRSIPSYNALYRPVNVKFCHEILSWFNVSHNTLLSLSPELFLTQKYFPGPKW